VNDRFARPGPGSHQSSRGFDSSDPFIPERHISSCKQVGGMGNVEISPLHI